MATGEEATVKLSYATTFLRFATITCSERKCVSYPQLSATTGKAVHCSHTCDKDVGHMGEELPDPSVPGSLSNRTVSVLIRRGPLHSPRWPKPKGLYRNSIYDNHSRYVHSVYVVNSKSHSKQEFINCFAVGSPVISIPGVEVCQGWGHRPVSRNNNLRSWLVRFVGALVRSW